jgi:hypothetical protein
MNCNDVQEWFGDYFDLPPMDDRRKDVDEHIRGCLSCEEEFRIWSESAELIRSSQDMPQPIEQHGGITGSVMGRIYAGEKWRIPVNHRIYAIPYKTRRNYTAIISLCLAMFIFSLLFLLSSGGQTAGDQPVPKENTIYGFHQAASISDSGSDQPMDVRSMTKVATASTQMNLMEPLMLDPIHSYPDYLLVLSILGLIATMLILNWFSRINT